MTLKHAVRQQHLYSGRQQKLRVQMVGPKHGQDVNVFSQTMEMDMVEMVEMVEIKQQEIKQNAGINLIYYIV